jgi:hypothetical protein
MAGLEASLTFTSLELRDAAMEDFDMEASPGFARAVMTRTYQLWEEADPDQKRRLQKLIFPEGVSFDGEAHGEALGTPVAALIFSVLGPEMTAGEHLVDQLRLGWKSIIAWLREVQAWSQPVGAESH